MIRDPLRSRVQIIPSQCNSPNSCMERKQSQLLIEAQECPRTLFITPINGNTRHYHDQDERAKIYGEMPYYQHELLSGSRIRWIGEKGFIYLSYVWTGYSTDIIETKRGLRFEAT